MALQLNDGAWKCSIDGSIASILDLGKYGLFGKIHALNVLTLVSKITFKEGDSATERKFVVDFADGRSWKHVFDVANLNNITCDIYLHRASFLEHQRNISHLDYTPSHSNDVPGW